MRQPSSGSERTSSATISSIQLRDAAGTGFLTTAQADINANNTDQTWGYNRLGAGGAQMPIAAGSGHTCTIGATGLQQNDQVGPCDSSYGQSEF